MIGREKIHNYFSTTETPRQLCYLLLSSQLPGCHGNAIACDKLIYDPENINILKKKQTTSKLLIDSNKQRRCYLRGGIRATFLGLEVPP